VLSPLDDLPIHQVPEPLRQVGTSDRNFYDRYYFNCHPCSDEVFLIAGLGQYPNLGVTDCFALVIHDGVHRVVRASRALGLDRSDTNIGPFHVDVIVGLQTLRVRLDQTDTDDGDQAPIEFDLTWEGAGPAIQEPRHTDYDAAGRVFLDACRLAQNGRWSGQLRVGDRSWAVTPDRWWGTRDRSWGIRPSGEPEPPGIVAHLPHRGFRWLYTPMQFDDHSLYMICQERADGRRVLEEAVRVWPATTGRAIESLGRPDYELTWDADNKLVERATLHLGALEVEAEPLVGAHIGVGTGYGFDAEWRHGMYQGDLVVQQRSWDLKTDEGRAAMWGIFDAVGRFRVDGQVGYGLFEYMFI
jgi:hypothetical protein